jgi:type IV pilus assembly protein PilA
MSRQTRQGFTLIELMVVVTILGVLAALAIPAFVVYIRRSKASEATANINNLFKAASVFYQAERTEQGIVAQTVTSCVVGATPISPANPSDDKQKFTATSNFRALGFSVADYVYYGYGIASIGNSDVITCLNGAPNTSEIYTFFAHGDLDGDGTRSTFELAVASDGLDQLYHSRGFYIVKEVE